MKIKKLAAFTAVAGVALTGVFATSLPASAEPVSNSYVAVGSDTLEAVVNALANGTNVTGSVVRSTANGAFIGSYDAFGSSAIQTKTQGVYFARPAGSGDGVKALSRSIDGANFDLKSKGNTTPTRTITGQVDIARSSSGPSTNANGTLAYIPFARDAVSYAYRFGSGVTAASGIESLSTADLTQIYAGTKTDVGGVAVQALLPQAGSGTRNFFLEAINGKGNTGTPAGATGRDTFAENDASVLQPPANTIQLIPFSAANWIAQSNGVTNSTIGTTGAQLGRIGGIEAFTVVDGKLVANQAAYSSGTFGRDTYLVVERARIDGAKFDANLAALLDKNVTTSLAYFGTSTSPRTAAAVKKAYGFLAPSNTTTLYGNAS